MATNYSKETADTFSEYAIAEELTLKPIILEQIKKINLKKKLVLDLGCGDGRYSKIFAEKGAKVISLDSSKFQIENANKLNKHPNVTYTVQDISDLSEINSYTVDLVFMNLVVPDLKDKNRLSRVFSEVSRVLKRQGILLFSVIHPLYLSPEQDPSDKFVDFKKENYSKEGHNFKAEALTKKENKIKFNETHFSLNLVSQILKENHLLIEQLFESRTIPEKKMFLPKYLLIKTIK